MLIKIYDKNQVPSLVSAFFYALNERGLNLLFI